MQPPLAIEAEGLVKAFDENRAVDGVCLAIPGGTVFGLLGPNGAGKTTLVRLLSTLLRPDSGFARVLGHDLLGEADAIRRRISLTGQFASVDEDLSGYENLVFLGRLLGLQRGAARRRAFDLLAAFGLEGAAGRQVKDYSGGMRRRLDIAASLLRTPELLFLDEPTTGLDPRSRNQVWEIVSALVARGTTVLLTTQYLEEADRLADRIAVVDRGKVIAEGTSDQLKASVGVCVLEVRVDDPAERERARAILAERLGQPIRPDGERREIRMRLAGPELATAALAALHQAGIAAASFSLTQPSLDEVFFTLTGQPAPNGDREDDAAREERRAP